MEVCRDFTLNLNKRIILAMQHMESYPSKVHLEGGVNHSTILISLRRIPAIVKDSTSLIREPQKAKNDPSVGFAHSLPLYHRDWGARRPATATETQTESVSGISTRARSPTNASPRVSSARLSVGWIPPRGALTWDNRTCGPLGK